MRGTDTQADTSAPDPAFLTAASRPQDQHPDAPALQVEYFPPKGVYSLHYFPYYGKKAQVRVRRCPQQLPRNRMEPSSH